MKKLLFLGTGTSNGVPVIGCDCPVCSSSDRKNRRLRTSVLYTEENTKIQIDVGPDFRQQALSYQIHTLNGVLLTHGHQDHIGGLDELRALNFLMQQRIPVFANSKTLSEVKARYSYLFKRTQKGGGKAQLDLHHIKPHKNFQLAGIQIEPLEVLHGKLSILGYRIDNLVYITDASRLPIKTLQNLKEHPPKILVLNALRYRPHPTHFSLEESLKVIESLQPEQTFLIHLTHRFEHSKLYSELPSNVCPAYDGLEIKW